MNTKILSGIYSNGYTLVAGYTAVSVLASGRVTGSLGATGASGKAGGAGGTGLALGFAVPVTNYGSLIGGAGGTGATGYAGGAGGAGAYFTSGGTLVNSAGLVQGGAGGAGGTGGVAGHGGAGVFFGAASALTNSGTVVGGAGGHGGEGLASPAAVTIANSGVVEGGDASGGGRGGDAVLTSGGSILNSGALYGGKGWIAGAGVTMRATGTVNNSGGHIKGGAGSFASGDGGDGVDLPGGAVLNTGWIGGGADFQSGGVGGAGASLTTGTVENSAGSITGGGGAQQGGDGVVLSGGGAVLNYALIAGGSGLVGGWGVVVTGGGTLSNLGGTIYGGGVGGGGYERFGNGPAGLPGIGGVDLVGRLVNSGVIVGGSGGAGTGSYYQSGAGGVGGVGVLLSGVLVNSGSITGGTGGAGSFGRYTSAPGGTGGVGVQLVSGKLINSGLIQGGAGGPPTGSPYSYHSAEGPGGAGVVASGAQSIANTGTIAGGTGAVFHNGYGLKLYGAETVTNGSSKVNTALIAGVYAGSASAVTITNYGSIGAGTQYSVRFLSAADRLIAEAGSAVGFFVGPSAVLELAGGADTLAKYSVWAALKGSAPVVLDKLGSLVVDAAASVTVSGAYNLKFDISNSGVLTDAGALTNGHSIVSPSGVALNIASGGSLYNLGLIQGATGVQTDPAGAVIITNSGTIKGTAGVSVDFTGASDELNVETGAVFVGEVLGGGGFLEVAGGATIRSLGAVGTLSGAASMTLSGFGQYDFGGANLMVGVNQLTSSQTLTLTQAGSLTNLGTLKGGAADAIILATGSKLTNGSSTVGTALIEGVTGVYCQSGPGLTVSNYGTIEGTGGVALEFTSGGWFIAQNGSTSIGTIEGGGGVLELAAVNGTISGIGGVGTLSGAESATFSGFHSYVVDGGTSWVVVGSNALSGNKSLSVSGSVTNLGSISEGSSSAIQFHGGGRLTNGSASVSSAVITGAIGLYAGAGGAVTITNFATVIGTGGTSVELTSSADRLIAGAGATFVGTATGDGATLELDSGAGTIGLGSGVAFAISGSVAGTFSNFSTVDVYGGDWTLPGGGALASGRTLVSGATVEIAGTFLDQGDLATTATGQILVKDGAALEIQGLVANAGTIHLASVAAAADLHVLAAGADLIGGGVVTLSGPKARILGDTPASSLTNVDNTIAGAGFIGLNSMTLANQAKGVIDANAKGLQLSVATKGTTLTNAGLLEATNGGVLVLVSNTIDQSAGGAILAAAGSTVDLQGDDVIGGTLNGANHININAKGGELDGSASTVTLSGLIQVMGGQNETINGAIANIGKLNTFASQIYLGTAGATLTGKGQVNLNDTAGNTITSLTGTVTLTNVDNHIDGAGQLGNGAMILVNQTSGQIVGNQTLALTINTGANTITNAGLIENVGKGGTFISSAINNTGTLLAVTAGTLTLAGAVTGAGAAQVGPGGTLLAKSSFTENVTFTGSTGVLELTQWSGYTGTIKGLSKSGTNSIDLLGMGFGAKSKATFSGTTAGGVLTVTNGTVTATLSLSGNYLGSTFVVTADGHGGTTVVDPPAGAAPSAAPLSQAMAAFAAPGAAQARLQTPPPRFAWGALAHPA